MIILTGSSDASDNYHKVGLCGLPTDELSPHAQTTAQTVIVQS